MSNIVLGKFDNHIKIHIDKEKILRIGSNNPNRLKFIDYSLISTDGKIVIWNDTIYSILDFVLNANKILEKDILVLTRKEKIILLEQHFFIKVKIFVFEELYSFFKNITYHTNIRINIENLKKNLKYIKKVGIRGHGLTQSCTTKNLFDVERKIRFKSSLDDNFFFAYKGGYQEVFKLKEERKDRLIIALDYNSMYPSCMDGIFSHPKKLKYEYLENKDIDPTMLNAGVYHVKLFRPKSEFIKSYHPFKYTSLGDSYSFNLMNDDNITLLLFENEVKYYMNHFQEVKVIEGIFSEECIYHPLLKKVRKLYDKRLRLKDRKDIIGEARLKFELAITHSSTNQRKESCFKFDNFDDLNVFLENNYSIYRPRDIPNEIFINMLQNSNYFKFKIINNVILCHCPNYSSKFQVHSLSSKVLANARLKMTQSLECFLTFPTSEICYVNTDSVHISINRDLVESFLMEYSSIISNKLGDFKIQCIAERGYWFDVGRYWLIDKSGVSKYANIDFNASFDKRVFVKSSKKLLRNRTKEFDFINCYYTHLYNSFSYKKKLDKNFGNHQRYTRFKISDIDSIQNRFISKQKEIFNSLPIKVDLFEKISSIYK